MMKRLIMKFVCMVVLLLPANCFAGLHDYPNIAILDFTNKAGVSEELTLQDGAIVNEFMVEELIDSDRFSVIEREQLQAILNEHSLNLSGVIDPSTAVQIGRLCGVEYLVYGSITGLSLKTGMVDVTSGRTGIGGKKNKVIANINVRVIDVETARIVLAARGEGASTSTYAEFDLDQEKYHRHCRRSKRKNTIRVGTVDVSQVQVHNALSKAVYDVVNGERGLLAKMDGRAKKKR